MKLNELKNKKIFLAPFTPLTNSFSFYLKNLGIDIYGYLDKYKTGEKVYSYDKLRESDFDYVIVYNEMFFWDIYKDIQQFVPKSKILRVKFQNDKYILLSEYEILYDRFKYLIFSLKIKMFSCFQRCFGKFLDFINYKRSLNLFISKDHIGSNVLYLYSYIPDNKIFITNSKNVKKNVKFNSLKSYFYVALAKNIIIDEGIFEYILEKSSQQNIIQLWHGIPLKKLFPLKSISVEYDYFISTSSKLNEKIFKHIAKAKKFLNYGYPRNDVLIQKKEETDFCDKKIYELTKKKTTIVYMPTYRDLLQDNIPPIDFEKLDDFCKKKDILFLVKFHPFINNVINLDKYKNIILYDSKLDIYPVLRNTDLLITDYSSVMYDFLLLDKPIILFMYDKEKYVKERGFFDFTNDLPGEVVVNEKELLLKIKELLSGYDNFKDKRKKIRNKFFDFTDDKSRERISKIL
jgi:CDP-glycerol glycerophosphotransferase (TagB/SpsB family)